MPAHIYHAQDGKRVPSVTTIRKHAEADSEGLLRWAHQLGLAGLDMAAERDAAAAVGTITHAWIDAELGGTTVDLTGVASSEREKVEAALGSWRAWRGSVAIDAVLGHEVSLVSERHRYGGTMDAVLMIGGRVVLADWKTGAGLYVADLVQVAAYGMLWSEANPERPVEEYTLLRLSKEVGCVGYTMKTYAAAAMDAAAQAFLLCRQIYDCNAALRRMIR